MTISTTTLKNSYSGNGSTTAFAYTFPINSTSEISVIERSATGTETVKSEGSGSTNYSIVDNGASGGTVTMVTAPASGTTLVLLRNTALTQETDYVANDPFPAETHEDALDKALMQAQELQEELDRSFKVSKTNTISSAEFTESATDITKLRAPYFAAPRHWEIKFCMGGRAGARADGQNKYLFKNTTKA